MDILTLAQKHVSLRKVSTARGGEYHGPCPACGTSQADPAKSDRFVVWPEKGNWMCRNCGSGDEIAFLRTFEDLSCPEAHQALGLECNSSTCAALDKCRLGRGKPAATSCPDVSLPSPPKPRRPTWSPAAATTPADAWRQKASLLVDWAHRQLLACQKQLDYLAGRGLPLEAVQRFRLGYLPQDLYRERHAWGLPEEISERTGKPKKLWLPCGIVIPYFDAQGVHRVRIRQPEKEPRYYWLPGSGDDVMILGTERRAHVVVESDLDALLVAWQVGDLVSAVPLGTCSAKPKQTATAQLAESLAILVALDFEPRHNPTTGQTENPGGKDARWWAETFRQSARWPVPAGKDPGEYYQAGGDVRAWIAAGLPPGLRRADRGAPQPPEATQEAPHPAAADQEPPPEEEPPRAAAPPPDQPEDVLVRAVSATGRPLVLVPRREHVAPARREYPEDAVFTMEEAEHLRGLPHDATELVTAAKLIFDGAEVLGTFPSQGKEQS